MFVWRRSVWCQLTLGCCIEVISFSRSEGGRHFGRPLGPLALLNLLFSGPHCFWEASQFACSLLAEDAVGFLGLSRFYRSTAESSMLPLGISHFCVSWRHKGPLCRLSVSRERVAVPMKDLAANGDLISLLFSTESNLLLSPLLLLLRLQSLQPVFQAASKRLCLCSPQQRARRPAAFLLKLVFFLIRPAIGHFSASF